MNDPKEIKKMMIIFSLIVIFLIILQLFSSQKIILYVDNGLDRELFLKISYLESYNNEENVEIYSKEELYNVEPQQHIKIQLNTGKIKIVYDTVIFRYDFKEKGTWLFNPYGRNNYGFKTITYTYPMTYTYDETYFTQYYSGLLNKIDADYILENPPKSILVKEYMKRVNKTVIMRK